MIQRSFFPKEKRYKANSTRDKGNSGEKIAARYLKKQKYKIIAKNYRKRFGEIDLICREEQTLVFVEVKMSQHDTFGPPEAWVNSRKQKQVAKVASAYLQEKRLENQECRFDVIGITVTPKNKPEIVHIRDAFRL